MKVWEIVSVIEEVAPVGLQEDYDNCGLVTGLMDQEVSGVLICLDITEEVIQEAIDNHCQLIVSHHPVVLKKGFRRLNGKSSVERVLIRAIKHDLAIYSAHTNMDSVIDGVSGKICQKLGLVNCTILEPKESQLVKLVVFAPISHASEVREVIFKAGGGVIGHYDCCSFNVEGKGSFRADDTAHPYVGEANHIHVEEEVRIETIMPRYLQDKVVREMIDVHPYEEVAYDLYPLLNKWNAVGYGMVGDLPQPVEEMTFLWHLKETFNCGCIRHSDLRRKPIRRVAVCGGSGSSLIQKAIGSGADIFVTGDVKYHQFFEAEGQLIIADIGHFESEQFTKEVFFELLTKKFPNFAIRLSKVNSNPIKYL